ncbi:red chlorophyll catabolite reductase, chloroplastic isoform X2 [Quercus suber]|uniref:Red chlorophyll catabolite reductase n=1 Tax=Quercus suber TaxID=58331 RepID=A0AAW0KWI6_QUESU|nr:red chlorophyll catabolite reductase, chloroplastic [Quercus suber]POE68085.1 red chlorophyll catabolite reductase, chloroplastic [Quercus suber]
MAVTLTLPVIFFGSHFPPSSSRSRSKTFSCCSSASSSQMELNNEFGVTKFKEFPYVSAPHRNLMVDLVSTVENRLGSQLLPCTLPPDVQYYQNQTGSAHASLHTRSGNKPSQSQIDFILGSWIHCELPTGGALNITSLSAFLNPLTDAPNFLIELIQSSPTSLILILDLPPRKDLVLCPDYLHTFYEETQLDTRKQRLEKIPEVKPYISSSLYIRSVVSPTAIMVRIETEASQPGRVEEVIKDHVDPIAKEVLGIWLDQCACGKREVGEAERAILEKRDGLIKIKTIEVDLGSNFPRLFGPEVANRVLGAIRDVYTV